MSSALIYKALRESPLLVDDTTVAAVFDRSGLPNSPPSHELSVEQKLGHLYEDGLAALLEGSDRYSLLEKGLQIQSDRTLGELDFLVRDAQTGGLIHLELAVKFYLQITSEPDQLLLPGPDARDNYFQKLEHLRSHQLTLTQKHRQYLPPAYWDEEITPQHLIIGCIFRHLSCEAERKVDGLHMAHQRGLWLRQSEFATYYPDAPRLDIIPKPLWPVPTSQLGTYLEPLDVNLPLTRCTMVRVEGQEQSLFITPDNYPEMDEAVKPGAHRKNTDYGSPEA